jgi:hypothetical protein
LAKKYTALIPVDQSSSLLFATPVSETLSQYTN